MLARPTVFHVFFTFADSSTPVNTLPSLPPKYHPVLGLGCSYTAWFSSLSCPVGLLQTPSSSFKLLLKCSMNQTLSFPFYPAALLHSISGFVELLLIFSGHLRLCSCASSTISPVYLPSSAQCYWLFQLNIEQIQYVFRENMVKEYKWIKFITL